MKHGIAIAICVSSLGCSLRRPLPVPPPTDFIVVHVQPVIVWSNGVSAVSTTDAMQMFSTIDQEYAPAKMRFDVSTPVRWDNPAVFNVDSDADWKALCAESKRIAEQEKAFAVFFVGGLDNFGENVVGISMYPPNHGCAILGSYGGTWVTGHEVGHGYGLKHVEPVRACKEGENGCSLMSYCQAQIPPCDSVFSEDECKIVWQWASVYPRLSVETHPDALRLPKHTVKAPEETVVCTP